MEENRRSISITDTISLAALELEPSMLSLPSIMVPRMLPASMPSIRPVDRITGIKKIARNTARPAIFWFSRTAMNREKIRIAGMSKSNSVRPVTRV